MFMLDVESPLGNFSSLFSPGLVCSSMVSHGRQSSASGLGSAISN